jgi:hypothetical protein
MEFYMYVKRRKGNRENIPAIKDVSGRLVTDPIEKLTPSTYIVLLYSAVSIASPKYSTLPQRNSS